MKLKEAFAKRTYGPRTGKIPAELSRKQIDTHFAKMKYDLADSMIHSLYEVWSDMRNDPEMMDNELVDDFPAYVKIFDEDGDMENIIEDWLDFRQYKKEIATIIKSRFEQ